MPKPTDDDDDEFLDTLADLGAATARGDTDEAARLDAKIKRKGWK